MNKASKNNVDNKNDKKRNLKNTKNESDVILEKEKSIAFSYILNSGISIKRRDSKNYQIHKFTPNSFLKIFNNAYIGAGAMIYTQKEKDFIKNKEIVEKIWNINEEDFYIYFNKIFKEKFERVNLINKIKTINKFSLNMIKQTIIDNDKIKNHIFTGKHDFEEPFSASYSFINNILGKYKYTDFYISQGSGRLKTPTIVIKPKWLN